MVDVLVIGAGMSGLTAARGLAKRNLTVCVLEAAERVGGRVRSQKVEGGGVAELGAEFVHGRAPELWALIAEAGVRTVERLGTMLREAGAGLREDERDGDTGEDMFASLEELKSYAGEDVPFAEWVAEREMEPWERAAVTGYVEGFNAADANRIGVRSLGVQQVAEDASEGDRSWHVVDGYARLAEYLAERCRELGVDLRLKTKVLGVRWSAGEVVVATAQGEVKARRCVVTLPLGALQRVNDGAVSMEPEPAAVAQARRLAMGDAARFTMVFRKRWWEKAPGLSEDALRTMNFVFTPQRRPPVWWTSHREPRELPMLTGWSGGPGAAESAGQSPAELGEAGCRELSQIFGVDVAVVREMLVETVTHDWKNDPLYRGAYSYVPAGAMEAPQEMTKAEAETMYFAGEHTDVTGNWGTVHAAIRSGLRVVKQVLGED